MILSHSDEVPLCCTVSQDPSETFFGICKYPQYFQKWCLTGLWWTFLYVCDTDEYNPRNETKQKNSLVWRYKTRFYPVASHWTGKTLWSASTSGFPAMHKCLDKQFQIYAQIDSSNPISVSQYSKCIREPDICTTGKAHGRTQSKP